jgi:hypothetical protein
MTVDPANTTMNERIRGTFARRRQRRDEQGRFTAEEHEHPDVRKLLKLRTLCAEAGDYQGVGEMDLKLRAISPELAPPLGSIDAGAARGQPPQLHRNSDDMNGRIRGSLRYQREQRAACIREELLGG